MEEIEADLIASFHDRSSPVHKISNEHDEGIDEELEEFQLKDSDGTMKMVPRKFYFVKIRSSFVDPRLSSKIESVKDLLKQMDIARCEIDSKKKKKHEERSELMSYRRWSGNMYRCQYIVSEIERSQRRLDNLGSGDGNNPSPETEEPVDIDEKIQELKSQLIHGSRNLAQERKTLKELKEMQQRKEQPACPRSVSKSWNSKLIHEWLKEIRHLEMRERIAKAQDERKKAEMDTKITRLEDILATINQKKAKLKQFILVAKQQLSEQTAYYDEQLTVLSKAKELATKKDLVALEELSNKQVEEFMTRWKSDCAFRANYTRSVTP